MRFPGPNNTIMHAEIRIGDSPIMLADEGQGNYRAPEAYGGSPVSLMVYVESVDEVFRPAVQSGARSVREVADQFYGDRVGTLLDPFGHTWTLGTHVEDVSEEEMDRRMSSMAKSA
jgi:PhnB protein